MFLFFSHKNFKKEIMGQPVKLIPSSIYQWLVIYDGTKQTFEPAPLFRVIKVNDIMDVVTMDVVTIVKPL